MSVEQPRAATAPIALGTIISNFRRCALERLKKFYIRRFVVLGPNVGAQTASVNSDHPVVFRRDEGRTNVIAIGPKAPSSNAGLVRLFGFALLAFAITASAANADCDAAHSAIVMNAADRLRGGCVGEYPELPVYGVGFTFQNNSESRTTAIKIRADLTDAFGDVIETWMITEPADLGVGDLDKAHWGTRVRGLATTVSTVKIYLLATAFADGSIKRETIALPAAGPPPTPDDFGLRRLAY